MVTTLILVRHGKAEAASLLTPDAERPLAPEGLAALASEAGFAKAFAQLGEDTRNAAELWVSPALRARQTAEEVVRAIGERPMHEHSSLWEQDLFNFADELADSDASCVIAVGHVPFMSEALLYYSGEGEGFEPGTVAAISLPDGPIDSRANESARLLWLHRCPRA